VRQAYPKIDNRTSYRTSDLRRFIVAGLLAKGADLNLHVEVRHNRGTNCGGEAVVGRDGRQGRFLRLWLPRPGRAETTDDPLLDLARTLEHEIDHALGLTHRDMLPFRALRPTWHVGLLIRAEEPKPRLTVEERVRARAEHARKMLEVHETYIKVAVDIQRGVLAGGGEFHADCEAVLIEEGSRREDVWGADWMPADQSVRCAALINIRPKVNPAMEIQDPTVRSAVEGIVRKLLQQS